MMGADGYLADLLRRGREPFWYRTGVLRLLGIPVPTGVQVRLRSSLQRPDPARLTPRAADPWDLLDGLGASTTGPSVPDPTDWAAPAIAGPHGIAGPPMSQVTELGRPVGASTNSGRPADVLAGRGAHRPPAHQVRPAPDLPSPPEGRQPGDAATHPRVRDVLVPGRTRSGPAPGAQPPGSHGLPGGGGGDRELPPAAAVRGPGDGGPDVQGLPGPASGEAPTGSRSPGPLPVPAAPQAAPARPTPHLGQQLPPAGPAPRGGNRAAGPTPSAQPGLGTGREPALPPARRTPSAAGPGAQPVATPTRAPAEPPVAVTRPASRPPAAGARSLQGFRQADPPIPAAAPASARTGDVMPFPTLRRAPGPGHRPGGDPPPADDGTGLNDPPPARPGSPAEPARVTVVVEPARRESLGRPAFWERRYLRRSRMRPLR